MGFCSGVQYLHLRGLVSTNFHRDVSSSLVRVTPETVESTGSHNVVLSRLKLPTSKLRLCLLNELQEVAQCFQPRLKRGCKILLNVAKESLELSDSPGLTYLIYMKFPPLSRNVQCHLKECVHHGNRSA